MSSNSKQQLSLFGKRVGRVRKKLRQPLLLTSLKNIRYLTGFTGTSATLLLSDKVACFITDRRYAQQAEQQVDPLFRIVFQEKKLTLALAEIFSEYQIDKVQVESDAFTYDEYTRLSGAIPTVKLEGTLSPVRAVRQRKDHTEIDTIKRALRITEEAMVYIAAFIKPGISEKRVAAELEYYCRLKGATAASFETIVASGPRSAMPHGVASDRIIQADELVLLDFGIVLDGYCSDFTRVVYTGSKLPLRVKRIWEKVKLAHDNALSIIKAGIPAAEPDKVARDFFSKKRVLRNYEHSLGHGVGLDIHESPRLSWQSEQVLEDGMVVTVEPGLYYPDYGGIRLEDMIVVRKDGYDLLTDFPLDVACIG